MLPFFLRHYEPVADRIFVHDDGSDDRSLGILEGRRRVTVVPFETTGPSYVEALRDLYDHCWEPSRGRADWVIVCNVDEHFDHPLGLRRYLTECRRAGVTAVPAVGYEMVADDFPTTGMRLVDVVRHGVPSEPLNKLGAFDPSAIRATNFTAGRHVAALDGEVVAPAERELRLLHFKYLGLNYLRVRYAELAGRRREQDVSREFGHQYALDEAALAARFESVRSAAKELAPAGPASSGGLLDRVADRITGRPSRVRPAA